MLDSSMAHHLPLNRQTLNWHNSKQSTASRVQPIKLHVCQPTTTSALSAPCGCHPCPCHRARGRPSPDPCPSPCPGHGRHGSPCDRGHARGRGEGGRHGRCPSRGAPPACVRLQRAPWGRGAQGEVVRVQVGLPVGVLHRGAGSQEEPGRGEADHRSGRLHRCSPCHAGPGARVPWGLAHLVHRSPVRSRGRAAQAPAHRTLARAARQPPPLGAAWAPAVQARCAQQAASAQVRGAQTSRAGPQPQRLEGVPQHQGLQRWARQVA
mmetsp:Transcript_21372/g.54386  ORF Transcript_21372/g.54386 Transcript_21372/m.54386 type:complete len:265 (+) Transcript_21372:147-941(+)